MKLNEDQKQFSSITSLAILRVVNLQPNDRLSLEKILDTEKRLLAKLEDKEPNEGQAAKIELSELVSNGKLK